MKKLTTILFVSLCVLAIQAQDIHNSQFFNAPLDINPALTGVFNGNKRITANYKSQWASIPLTYNTLKAAYDQAITSKSDSTGYFSLGATLDYDKAGVVDFTQLNFMISGSYSYRINDKSLISPGLSIGVGSKRFDAGKITSANQWNGQRYDEGIPAEGFDANGVTFLDLALGLNYHRQTSFRSFIDIGAAMYHVTAPDQSYNNSTLLTGHDRRISFSGLGSFQLTKKLDLLTNVLLSLQAPHRETLLNAQGKLYLERDSANDLALYFGLGLRLGDALYPMIAVEYNNIYAGFNYDINFSDFNEKTNGRGGPELSFRYLFYKVTKVPFKPCPIY